ncbi:MAG: metalloprotease TldD [Nitrospirota bacterium]
MTERALVPQRFFESRFGVTARDVERVMARAMERRVDYADLYFEYEVSEGVSLEEGLVKTASRDISQGVGVRAIADDRTGYAYSNDISIPQIDVAAQTARSIADAGASATAPVPGGDASIRDLYAVDHSMLDAPLPARIDLLQEIDRLARAYDPRIRNVMASLSCESKVVLVVTSDGTEVGDVRPLARLNVTCIAQDGSNRQIGSYGGGGRIGWEFFFDEDRWRTFTREAARRAIVNLSARPAPAGTMTVVLGPGWPGILLHEAIGHGLEADFNRKGVSAFSNRLGQRVASELCTIVDDGTIPWRRGSLNVDDEGSPSGRTVLIEHGILKGYLQDKLNARLMKMPVTGNGRRESFAHAPMPRMTNTFMLPGASTPEEILASVDHGLYAVSFGGGQVDITSGKFVFSASEAYLIEKGRVTHPVKGATLIGNGPDVLTRVSMVGNDLALDPGVGTCGKEGQSVPVGVGLPTIRIDGLTVGGTQG